MNKYTYNYTYNFNYTLLYISCSKNILIIRKIIGDAIHNIG
jgi:hypothetical protein